MKATRPWSLLEGRATGRACLVIGNGPSRRSARLDAFRYVLDHDAVVIACNAYWRELPDWPAPDLLVCYDATQAREALAGSSLDVIVPEQRDDPVFVEATREDVARMWVAAPHRGTATADDALDARWHPRLLALGNFAGLLAYQTALLLGCDRVALLGIDCGGILSGDRVSLSSVGEGTLGYGPSDVPKSVCVAINGALVPRCWEPTRDLWRALTRRGDDLGIETVRLIEGGALDWLPALVAGGQRGHDR